MEDCCLSCGLHQNCQSYAIRPEWDTRIEHWLPDAGRANTQMLVLGQAPGYYEDADGGVFLGPSGKFLRSFLKQVEVRWVLHNAVQCYPGRDPAGGGDIKPSYKQIRLCSDNMSLPRILEQCPKLKVIVCLGDAAMKAVLGEGAPRSIAKARGAAIRFGGYWVLVTYHPSNHVADRMDLTEEYLRVFKMAEDIALDRVKRSDANIIQVESKQGWNDFIDVFANVPLGSPIALDVEVGVPHEKEDPRQLTIWHPDTTFLSLAVTWHTDKTYETWALPLDLIDRSVLKAIFYRRWFVGHNFKFDIQALWRYFRFDAFKSMKRWDDTFLLAHLLDQSIVGNGLEALCNRVLGVAPWKDMVWTYVDKRNKEIEEQNKETRKTNRLRLKDGLTPLPVLLKNADFRDVPVPVLLEYNGTDTHNTLRLFREHFGGHDLNPTIWPSDTAYQLAKEMVESLCYVEREGLPASAKRYEQVKGLVDLKMVQIEQHLAQQPEIQAITDLNGPCIDLNPKSPKFLEALVAQTGAVIKETTPTGRPKLDKTQVAELARLPLGDKMVRMEGEPPDATERDRAAWLWYYVHHLRQYRDTVSKFIGSLPNFIVDGRIHTTFHVGKVEVPGRSGASEASGGAESGRVSSYDPNLQNLKNDYLVRCGIMAPPGWAILEADFDRVEPVWNTWYSECPKWRAIFDYADQNPGDPRGDLYKVIAAEVWAAEGVTPENVTKAQRQLVKILLLALTYDQHPWSFAKKAGVDIEIVMAFYKSFYERFPELLLYSNSIKAKVFRGEMVETAFHRRRSFPLKREYDYDWQRHQMVPLYELADMLGILPHDGHVLRECTNFTIQSAAADLTFKKLYRLVMDLLGTPVDGGTRRLDPTKIAIINTVHDAIWFLVRKPYLPEAAVIIKAEMEDMSTLPPLKRGGELCLFDMPQKVSFKLAPENLGVIKEVSLDELARYSQTS